MIELLIVCTGNICRSPMAETLLRRKLAEHGLGDVHIASAGTGAWDGEPASEGAYLVSLEHGLDLSAHRARLLTRDLVESAHLIFAMSRHHRMRAEQLGGGSKTHLVGEYAGRTGEDAEVRDPFGGAIEGYRECFAELEVLTDLMVSRLAREVSGDQR